MINSAIDDAGEAADAGKDVQGPTSFSDNVLVFEAWVTNMVAALTDDSADGQRLKTIFDGVAELYRELVAQQLIERNEGRSDSDAYRKFEALKPKLQVILDDVRRRFMALYDVVRPADATHRASGVPPAPAIDKGIGKIDDVAMEARFTRLEVNAEHTAKTVDTMQKRMDDGFREVRSSIEALRKRMDEGFYAAQKRMDDGSNVAHKRMDDGFGAARATSDSLLKRMDDGFKEANKRMDDGSKEANKRMDDGFDAARARSDSLQKRMEDGFKEANKRMHDGFEAAHKRMDDGFKEARATSDSLQKRMDDGFRESRSEVAAALKEVRSEASANFRVLVGIQVTTLLAVITMLAKMANMF